MQEEQQKHNFALIAVVAIVAIVALVVLVMNVGRGNVPTATSTGEAFEISQGIGSPKDLGLSIDSWIDEVGGGSNVCNYNGASCSGTCGSGTASCYLSVDLGKCCCSAGCK